MPSLRRRRSAGDTDRVEESPPPAGASEAKTALTLAEEAEAQAAEAEAAAEAARARARAIRLRQEAKEAAAKAAGSDGAETDEAPSDDEPGDGESGVALSDDAETGDTESDETGEDRPQQQPARSSRRWGRIIKAVAMSLAILCTGALLAASGYMVWQHRQAADLQKLQAEYAAAGRQSVVTLMSLDFNNAEADVQRIIENSTGQFRTDFEAQAKDFVQVAQDSKVVTDVTVNSTAVEKMSQDSAVVLVAATSRVTNAAGAQQEPRAWRLSVDLQRDGDQIKMSKVEFVP